MEKKERDYTMISQKKLSAICRRLPALAVLAALAVSCTAGGVLPAGRSLTARAETPAESTVLFSENFDGLADGSLPDGWTVSSALEKGGSAAVRNGALVIDASGVELGKVLLPDTLAEYENYTFEADLTFDRVRDAARWFSLVFRQQETDEMYYQMCVRSGTSASNGVELAVRSPGAWNVLTTASAADEAATGTTVHLKMSLYGSTVLEYFDGDLVIESDALGGLPKEYKAGRLGLQANFSVVTVDNITVTALTENPAGKDTVKTPYVAFDRTYTSIVCPATVITEINSRDTLQAVLTGGEKPQVLMLYVDRTLTVTDQSGAVTVGSADEVMRLIDKQCIPAFYVKTQEAADALGQYLKENKIVDAFVLSDNPALVASVRSTNRKIYGVVDYRSVSPETVLQDSKAGNHNTLDEIVYTTNENRAKTALISESIATKENVQYLQNRLITVWVAESAERPVQLHNAVQSGANGILTDTPDALYDTYSFYADNYTLVRNPLIVGHRGLPSAAPENSLESAVEAYNAGADCIELDIRLSKDGVVMIYHDDDISGLTTGKGTINSHTFDELRSYDLLRSSGYGTFEKYPKVKIPTLEEFFKRFQNEDVLFFIEIKETSKELITKTAGLIEQYNMKNKVAFITFIASQIAPAQEAVPGVSVGYLMSTPSAKSTEQAVQSIFNSVGPVNTTFNATGINDVRLVRALMHRGMTCWPWTYNASTTGDAYLLGVSGITTDHVTAASDIPTEIRLNAEYAYTLSTTAEGARELTYSPTVLTRTGEMDPTALQAGGKPVGRPELILLEGNGVVTIDGDTVRAVSPGTAYLLYRYNTSTNPFGLPSVNNAFTLYSQLITITVVDGEVSGSLLPTPIPEKGRFDDFLNGPALWGILGALAVIAVLLLVIAIAAGRKKSRKKAQATQSGQNTPDGQDAPGGQNSPDGQKK